MIILLIKVLFGYKNVETFWIIREKVIKLEKKDIRTHIYNSMCSIIRRRYGAGIPTLKTIMPFRTPHAFHGIFISKYAKVESGCTIFQHVTIGQNELLQDEKKGSAIAPTIGKNCYIGAGAKIIGPCNIGDNVRIGAGAIVVENIPDNATVVMNKPRVIIREKTREKA
ncbi:serine acetyltransferase [Aristaeella hokkaidonensis]|uniref:Serine acetyltransferase n=1 Tax=Aristaeella hokkaidonensis TaxID=3046382 RepID=A0AC61N073_9FIRM|nr:serine acetyltransferase [Aristaeella hokkaidonensis]QUC68218.1 serine acetyltransferase [Aristaeella hokkaidonensis]SNT95223.1 serine O-acetyltransferase [Aristaeella hokkaidonensis]